jgi:histidine triad (HIT) family protein
MTIFSKIINGEIPSYKITENEKFYAFLDIFPLQKGHTLIVPKIEVDKIFDVPDTYLNELMQFVKPIAKAIESSFSCNRVSMVTIGLEVPHAHVHLIPINAAEDIHFSNPKLQLSKEDFLQIQQLIISKLVA